MCSIILTAVLAKHLGSGFSALIRQRCNLQITLTLSIGSRRSIGKWADLSWRVGWVMEQLSETVHETAVNCRLFDGSNMVPDGDQVGTFSKNKVYTLKLVTKTVEVSVKRPTVFEMTHSRNMFGAQKS